MNIAAESGGGAAPAPSCADAPEPRGKDAPAAASGNRLADAAVLAIMGVLAIGAAALVCGVYNAFDDEWFGMSGSTLSRILALAGF
ncbi:hypothetical protein VAPA_2c03810 [Variovorax paradoxus B4]|uniref:Uncharacterized protein n=1 Tax=Variovorax paradoxus B4 TaxID=1246301 RepID=T1XK53_VARPD|nr:hypothetical protein [Variovorax paradoxus]AGU52941.1 hypothetical protein VAPA_2c03810 [Variovorax paradoxus B4]